MIFNELKKQKRVFVLPTISDVKEVYSCYEHQTYLDIREAICMNKGDAGFRSSIVSSRRNVIFDYFQLGIHLLVILFIGSCVFTSSFSYLLSINICNTT